MRRVNFAILLSLSLSASLACTNTSGRSSVPDADFFVAAGQAFLMRFGDTAGVSTPTQIVIVRFTTVLSDSRCPEEVTCVTAGEASIVLTVQTSLALNDVTIAVPPSGEAEVEVEGVTIQVVTLRPAAMEGVTIAPIDYAVGLRVLETSIPTLPS